MRMATIISFSLAMIMALAKALAWWQSGSVSLLAGLTDSLLDGAASLLNLLAVHYALRPADEDHSFGHGKAEALAGLGQALFIAASSLLVATQGIRHLINPQPIDAEGIAISVIALSLVLTIGLVIFQNYVVKKTGSTAIKADSLHYKSDLLLNISILVALLLNNFGFLQSDALFALGISLYILWSAVQITRQAITVLMDTELSDHIIDQIQAIARNVPGVIDVHDLRTRISGIQWFIQLHAEFPGEWSLLKTHHLCQKIEDEIKTEFPQADILVHADPIEVVSNHVKRR
ncbi:UNVERIFIED_CONTAM: hypothetical protein GTU68_034675 [Idotea baltica]|nr:hypothetical protein [Idotea baltica]